MSLQQLTLASTRARSTGSERASRTLTCCAAVKLLSTVGKEQGTSEREPTLIPEHVRPARGREVGQLLGCPLGTPLKLPGGPRASRADQAGHIVAGHVS